ncbi:MAG: ribonuclease [Parcubacteria group bacterium]|nr:ribonuclease [Parcubacteria group bacterium]
MITIFTDGSSKGNPGPGGWGAILATDEKVTELGGREPQTTNNRMELTAAIRALQNLGTDEDITVYTDAEYVLKGITQWVHGWLKNDWRTAAKKPVENQDLWKELLEAVEGKDIKWMLVRGHAGVPANERCDEIATTYADNLKPELYDGPIHAYTVSLKAIPRI